MSFTRIHDHHLSFHFPALLLLAFLLSIPTYQNVLADPIPGCYEFKTPLKAGSRHPDVAVLQKFLISKGYTIDNASGRFGSQTVQALKHYQSSQAIRGNGNLGPLTRSHLNSLCVGSEGIVVPVNNMIIMRELSLTGVSTSTSSIASLPLDSVYTAPVPVAISRHVCAGEAPSGPSTIKGGDYYTVGYGTTEWTFVTGDPGACQWSCERGSGFNGSGCAKIGTFTPTLPARQVCNGTKPVGSDFVSLGSDYYSTGYGTTRWTFVTNEPGACQYSCKNGGVYTSAGCVQPEIKFPTLSRTSWFVDDPSTWPVVSEETYLTSDQAVRVRGTNGDQYFTQQNGVRSGKLTSSPPAGTTVLETYVYDYATQQKIANKEIRVTVTRKPVPIMPTTQACAGTMPSGEGVKKGHGLYTTGYGTTRWTFVTTDPYACQWSCESGFGLSGNGCAPIGSTVPTFPVRRACEGLEPSDSIYVTKGGGYYSTGYPTTHWTFVTTDPGACQYTCKNAGIYTGTDCVSSN